MRISFQKSKLERLANSDKEAVKKLGKQGANKLRLRLDELDAAICLEDMRTLPAAHCHELKGKLKGSLALNLSGGWRLIFEPEAHPPPTKEDGGLDWTAVDAIHITDIRDYHD